jgi:hypothetical protein
MPQILFLTITFLSDRLIHIKIMAGMYIFKGTLLLDFTMGKGEHRR